MAGRRVLCVSEYFGAFGEWWRAVGAGKVGCGNCEDASGPGARGGCARRSFWGARAFAIVVRDVHRTHRGRVAAPGEIFCARGSRGLTERERPVNPP